MAKLVVGCCALLNFIQHSECSGSQVDVVKGDYSIEHLDECYFVGSGQGTILIWHVPDQYRRLEVFQSTAS